jgi:uncharacterized protein (DUF305 family)
MSCIVLPLALAAGPARAHGPEDEFPPFHGHAERMLDRLERQIERMQDRLEGMRERLEDMRDEMSGMRRGGPDGWESWDQGMMGPGTMGQGPMGQGMMGERMEGFDNPVVRAFRKANLSMHRGMNTRLTGDADRDFAASMIPHHQGAIDMAKILLEHGKDPELRALAEAIVKAQEAEIAQMQAWLDKHPAP